MNAALRLPLGILALSLAVAPLRASTDPDWKALAGDWIADEQGALVKITPAGGLAIYPADNSPALEAKQPAYWDLEGAPTWKFETGLAQAHSEDGALKLGRVDNASGKTQIYVCRRADAKADAAILERANKNVAPVAGAAAGAEPAPSTKPPRVTYQVRPVYPPELYRAGIRGEVLVDFVVNNQGDVVQAFAASSSNRRFEAPAVAAVTQWKFVPGQIDGRPVNTHLKVSVKFDAPAPANPANGSSRPK